MTQEKELPVLLSEKEVKRLLGRVPRSLENMVMSDVHHKPPRKFFLREEVFKLLRVTEASQYGRIAAALR